jgi:transposase-like protein
MKENQINEEDYYSPRDKTENYELKIMFKEYYIGRKGIYHNKNVVIIATSYDIFEYQDFGFKFDEFEITIYYEDGSKKTEKLKGNLITKNLKLYENKR